MESTGVYWKPVLNVLEDDPAFSLQVVVANPQQVKAVTGHKTDPHDAKWLAHLASWHDPAQFHSSQADPRTAGVTRRRKQMPPRRRRRTGCRRRWRTPT